jgi:hypothetical protein
MARGWAVFRCSEHGDVAATEAWLTVTCKCGRRAQPFRGKRQVRAAEARALKATLE